MSEAADVKRAFKEDDFIVTEGNKEEGETDERDGE